MKNLIANSKQFLAFSQSKHFNAFNFLNHQSQFNKFATIKKQKGKSVKIS